MNGSGKTKKKPITALQALKVIVFLLILTMLFDFFTALYDAPESERMVEYEELPDHSIDAVAIGASTVYSFYDPMEAWERLGIASYAYGFAAADGENAIYSVKQVLKNQSPKVLLVEVRGFLESRDSDQFTKATYRYIKNYKNPFDRWKILNHYRKLHGVKFSSDQLPYYLTLILRHENYWSFLRPGNWKRVLTRAKNSPPENSGRYYGFSPHTKIVPALQTAYDPEAESPLGMAGDASLREVLDYCREAGQEVVLVSSPFVCKEEDIRQLNTIAHIAEEYGVPFLNCNKDAELAGIDFTRDFYNPHHTNLSGAIKYTNYIMDYLESHYDLPDHRGDSAYAAWEKRDAEYQAFRTYALELLKNGGSGASEGSETSEEEGAA